MIQPADRLKGTQEYYFSKKLEQIRQMNAAGGTPVINLGIGSPDLSPASEVLDATANALHQKNAHGYAPYRSSPELRRAMAEWYQKGYGVSVDANQEVLPLLGSKEGILYISLAYLNPGDEALVPNPGYPAYSSVTSMIGAKARLYDLNEKDGWEPDWEQLEKEDLSRCKIMWVNYPHMPTGAPANRALFDRLIDFGRRKNILICHDNPYGWILNQEKPLSILEADLTKEWSLELNSMSKAFNMAGWRVGMLLANSQVIDAVLQVKSNVDSGMFSAVQAGAEKALHLPDSWHEERNEIYKERRDVVWKIFDRLGFQYDRKAVGLFVWAKAPATIPDVPAFLDTILENARVFLTPGMIFGSNGNRYARSSLCGSVDTLKEALRRIDAIQSPAQAKERK
ncbi:MAG: pyridoxal phosphate-dependent aminotransferase [Bdellovibrionia bacterium]